MLLKDITLWPVSGCNPGPFNSKFDALPPGNHAPQTHIKPCYNKHVFKCENENKKSLLTKLIP